MRTALLALVAACLTAGCSTAASTTGAVPFPDEPSAAPVQQGGTPEAQLRGMLLTLTDVPALVERRESASADLTTQATPQLALCTAGGAVAAHEIASVIAKPGRPGQAQVFELLSVFATPAAARQAFDAGAAAAGRCRSYSAAGTPFRVVDVGSPSLVGADAALQYRLTTPNVVSGDVRTLAVSGRSLVLLTGYGAPPAGQTLLGFQASVMVKALHRLMS